MNTFWLKIAGVGIVVLVVLIVAGQFVGGDDDGATESAQNDSDRSPSANVYEQDAKDHERLTAPVELSTPQTLPDPAETTVESTPAPLPEFAKLTTEQQVAAERLWEMTEAAFKIGRKPMMTFGNCVKYARQIIEEFPNTEYAIRAKRVLNDIVEMRDQYKSQYHITDEELDMGPFK